MMFTYFSSCLNKQIDYLCTMDNNSCIRQQADIKQINRCKDRVSELNGSFDYLSNGLELAGNNVRLKILFLIYEEKRLCVCDISDILGMMKFQQFHNTWENSKTENYWNRKEKHKPFFTHWQKKSMKKMLKPFFKILDENKILETLWKQTTKTNQTGLLTAIAASLCCITPVLAFIAGTSGLVSTFSWLEPFRPYFIGLTILVLGFVWYQKLKPKKQIDCNCETEEKPKFIQSKCF